MQEEQQTPETSAVPESTYKKRQPSLFGRYFFFLFICVLAFGGVYQLGFEKGRASSDASSGKVSLQDAVLLEKNAEKDNVDFGLFWKVWDLVRERHVDSEDLDAREMMYGAIQGMLTATDDPYTSFLNPEENEEFNEEIRGTFEGIGAEIGLKKGVLTIVAPLQDSPAEKAGLRAGDKILKIGDEETATMGIDVAVGKMRGPKGTELKMTIFRDGDDETREVAVIRDVIDVKSVTIEISDDSIAYVRITRFGDDTVTEFEKVVDLMKQVRAKGIILDVRNNPGGYLDAAIDMASRLLPKGSTIVIEEDHEGRRSPQYTSRADMLSGVPTVILINGGSASASEILAGALRDNRQNVTIVGEKSYGKGSVQELIPLSQKSAVKITVAKWLTPKGEQINDKGIEPDVEVKLSDEDYDNDRDPQLDKAKETLRVQL